MVYDELLPPGKELIDQTVAFAEKNFKKWSFSARKGCFFIPFVV
jgi:hypothetical protein